MAHIGGGKQEKLIALMGEHAKTQLWIREDFMEHFGWDKIPAENAVYNAWRTGKIYRHKEPDKEGNKRYGLSIKEESRAIYKQSKTGGGTTPGITRKKKKSLPSAKELRKMFAEHMNQMAQLEDTMLAVVERQEELEKTISKIEQLIP